MYKRQATERARAGITKAWKGSEDEVKEAERKILQKQYEDMVAPGQHTGGKNLLTGQIDNYFVTDLPPRDDVTNACNFMSCDNEELRQAHTMMKAASSPRLSRKINVYIDRFLYMLSSIVPASREKDIDLRSFNILSYGTQSQQPKAFFLPSEYLACTVFLEDVRLHDDLSVWDNDKWKPSSDMFSPIELYNFRVVSQAINTKYKFKYEDAYPQLPPEEVNAVTSDPKPKSQASKRRSQSRKIRSWTTQSQCIRIRS